MAGVVAPLGLAIGAATSAVGAAQQNKAIARSQRSTVNAATVQQNQLAQSAANEKRKRLSEVRAIEGRLRVVAADAGVGIGGSYEALLRQNDIDTATNIRIIEQNYTNGVARIQSGASADLDRLAASTRNPILDTFTGALQGLQSGLAIAGGLSALKGPPAP